MKKNTQKRQSIGKEFFKAFGISFCLVIVSAAVIFSAYIHSLNKDNEPAEDEEVNAANSQILVIGEDKADGQADIIYLYLFNGATNSVHAVNIPPSTAVSVPSDLYQKAFPMDTVVEDGKEISFDQIRKELSGTEKYNAMQQMASILTGIEVKDYIATDMEDIANIFTPVGDVTCELSSEVEYQDDTGETVTLEEGTQTVSLEVLKEVLYYANEGTAGQVDKIKRQNEILLALLKQAGSKQALEQVIVGNFSSFVTNLKQENVAMNVSKYKAISASQLNFQVIPGNMVLNDEDENQYTVSVDTIKGFIQGLLSETQAADQSNTLETDMNTPAEEEIVSTDKKIIVHNGTSTTGLAKKYQDKLDGLGFNVTEIGNASQKLSHTKIIVNQEGMGNDLTELFTAPTIEVDTTMTNCDILIIIGEDDIE